jgi:hypothetical protein
MSTKQAVLEMLDQLPESASWQEIVELGNAKFAVEEEPELSEEEWKRLWIAECNRRKARTDAGEAVLLDGREVMNRFREKFG